MDGFSQECVPSDHGRTCFAVSFLGAGHDGCIARQNSHRNPLVTLPCDRVSRKTLVNSFERNVF